MISNLASARALIQADLAHARCVLALWSEQVSELEKALEQINSVDKSRTALRGASQAQKGSMPRLTAGNGPDVKGKRARKPKRASVVQSEDKGKKRRAAKSASSSVKLKTAGESPRVAKRSSSGTTTHMEKKRAVPGAAKYRDPNSGKTWTGHGRRPGWMVGAPAQYAIDAQAGSHGAPARKNSEAATAAMAPSPA